MNKLLVLTVLVALLALSVESFRMPRQVEAEEEVGLVTKFTDTVKSYYNSAVNTTNEYLENIKALKLEERLTNAYRDTTEVLITYGGIAQDQFYHFITQQ